MNECRLLNEDGECPNGLEPAWCSKCSGTEDEIRRADRTIDYSFTAQFTSMLDCGHHPSIGEAIARMRSGRTKCHTCSGMSNNPRLR